MNHSSNSEQPEISKHDFQSTNGWPIKNNLLFDPHIFKVTQFGIVDLTPSKQAKDAARAENGKGGTVENHTSPTVGNDHCHGVSQSGEKNRVHHEYNN